MNNNRRLKLQITYLEVVETNRDVCHRSSSCGVSQTVLHDIFAETQTARAYVQDELYPDWHLRFTSNWEKEE